MLVTRPSDLNETPRRFHRSLSQAWPRDDCTNASGISGPESPLRQPVWVRVLRALNLARHIRERREANEYQRNEIAEHQSMHIRSDR